MPSATPDDWFEETEASGKARKKPFSTTAATLKWARKTWGDEAVTISSWWQSHGRQDPGGEKAAGSPFGVRKDLYGFIDAVVLDGLPGLLGLQACGGGDVAKHQRKMAGEVPDRARLKPERLLKAEIDAAKLAGRVCRWLAAGNRLVLVSWRQVWVDTGPRTKAKTWRPRFLEARLPRAPDGAVWSGAPVLWTEHETWPPRKELT